jgi:hypothetical protein
MFFLALFFAVAPVTNDTSWMRLDSFHLTIGMPKADALQSLIGTGVKPRDGDHAGQTIVDITPTRSLTLEFTKKNRLQSVRFEFFTMPGAIGAAFAEEKKFLHDSFGAPKPIKSKSMVIYDTTLPHVMAVVTTDMKKGLGTLVVRYYDPAKK